MAKPKEKRGECLPKYLSHPSHPFPSRFRPLDKPKGAKTRRGSYPKKKKCSKIRLSASTV